MSWKYDSPRNVGFATPVSRSVWKGNVVCNKAGSVDTLRFYDAAGAEAIPAPEAKANIVAGLNSEALPAISKRLCGN